jgi:homogentisate 1,2-dioxygenase
LFTFLNSWLYRIRPSVVHTPFKTNSALDKSLLVSKYQGDDVLITPTQIRWSPFDLPVGEEKVNFVQGLKSLAGAGDPACRSGLAVHVYAANVDMGRNAFYDADGDFLIGMMKTVHIKLVMKKERKGKERKLKKEKN